MEKECNRWITHILSSIDAVGDFYLVANAAADGDIFPGCAVPQQLLGVVQSWPDSQNKKHVYVNEWMIYL